jgi:exosortase O
MGLNGVILLLWLRLYTPIFSYLHIIFQREDFRLNQIVLVAVLALIGLQLRREGIRPQLDAAPRLRHLPLALALGGAAAYLLVERFWDINMLAACLFALASYGLLGLWLSPHRWRQGLPAVLLLIGVLPFGEHLQTFVGYPMRIFTAEMVQQGFTAVGIHSIGVDTILIFENGISQVDLPCSGVKSLWTGMLFLLAATWVEARPLNRRWFLVLLLFAPLLFAANFARVAVLVFVGQVMGWTLLAEMLHVPLGVLGFVVVCATAAWLWRVRATGSEVINVETDQPAAFSHTLSLCLILAILMMIPLYAQRPQTGLTAVSPTWHFPDALQIEPLPLKPDENEWLTRDGATAADRFRFRWGNSSGTMILITSQTWRAHHRPERCFEVYGLTLDSSQPYLVTADFPLRLVTLGKSDQRQLYTASYWFQSAARTTDDYGARIWADVTLEREPWVLVSILFDDPVDPHDTAITALYLMLHEAADTYLQ